MRYKTLTCAALLTTILFSSTQVHATSNYQQEVDVQFTFRSSLSVVIDSAEIEILDLAPGTSSDSNVVGINISTNNILGYTASATVGGATDASHGVYASTNMVRDNGNEVFTSIATNASQATLTTDNTWGYSTSTNNSAWTNYSGLPLYTADAKQIASTNTPVQDAIKFKINAKAATSQPAGDYRNVINFIVVANTPPRDWDDVKPDCNVDPTKCDSVTGKTAIQAVDDAMCSSVEVYDTQFEVTDKRDHKNYWISKLQDDHCWMTQNLDLDLTSGVALTNETTDLGWNGTSYTTSSWTPNKTTYSFASETGDAIQSDPTGSYSADPGDYYEQGTWFPSEECNYLASCSTVISNTEDDESNSPNGTHGHVGNYYSWTAAIATNNTTGQSSLVATNSICPTNWRLPSVGADNDFASINTLYNSGSSSTDSGLFNGPVYLVRAGFAPSGSVTPTVAMAGSSMNYWSNESTGTFPFAYYLNASSSSVSTKTGGTQYPLFFGYSVRCIVRERSPFVITFNANGGAGTMNNQTIERGVSTPLTSNAFTRSGYIFNGWNTRADGLGAGYGNGAQYLVATSDSNTGTTLYATWIKDDGSEGGIPDGHGGYRGDITIGLAYELAYTEHGKTEYKGHFKMQDINLTYNNVKVCDLVTVIGDDYIAIDSRDDKLYHITKTKDGNCWMTQNLDYDIDKNEPLSSTTSDLTVYGTDLYSSTYGYAQDGTTGEITWTPLNSTIPESGISSGLVADWQSDNYRPYSLNVGDWYWIGSWDNNGVSTYYGSGTYNYLKNNTGGKFSRTPFAGNGTHGHVGNYYNWPAAIASNYTYDYAYGKSEYNTDNSICPAGWRLPTSSYNNQSSNEFVTLLNSYNAYTVDGDERDKKTVSSPLWFIRNGYVQQNPMNQSNLIFPGSDGNYQSRTASNLSSAYTFNFNYGTVRPDYSGYNDIGRAIRCLAR